MCSLQSNSLSHDTMRRLFDVTPERTRLGNLPALTAIFPKYEAPIVAIGKDGERALIRSHWGFLTPNKSKTTGQWLKPRAWHNTRDDKLMHSGLWKQSFLRRRCLVPASAYAETAGRAPAIYHWFRVIGAEGFAFAGIWSYHKGLIGEEPVDTLAHSIVTTPANALTSACQTRMPAILPPEAYEAWLTGPPEAALELVQPFPAEAMEVIAKGPGLKEEPAPVA